MLDFDSIFWIIESWNKPAIEPFQAWAGTASPFARLVQGGPTLGWGRHRRRLAVQPSTLSTNSRFPERGPRRLAARARQFLFRAIRGPEDAHAVLMDDCCQAARDLRGLVPAESTACAPARARPKPRRHARPPSCGRTRCARSLPAPVPHPETAMKNRQKRLHVHTPSAISNSRSGSTRPCSGRAGAG